MSFVVYDASTGNIVSFSNNDADASLYESPGYAVVTEVGDILSQIHLLYVVGGELISRPQHPCQIDTTTIMADGSDAVTLSGVLPNSMLILSHIDTGEEISGPISGTDTFTTTVVGRYKLRIKCWPYLDREEIIDAV